MTDETQHTGILTEQNIDHLCWLQVQDRAMLTPIDETVEHYQDTHDVSENVAEAATYSKAQQIGFTIEHLIGYGLDVFGRAERHARILGRSRSELRSTGDFGEIDRLGTYEQDMKPTHVELGDWAFDPPMMDEEEYEDLVEETVDPHSEPYKMEWTD